MSRSLFDVFGRLLLEGDGKEFVAQAKAAGAKAGDAAGQSMGQRVSSTLKTAFAGGIKVVAGAASAAFGVATKGALEMENATARYRAETGATAEEAQAALRAANSIAGSQRQSLDSVVEASMKVRKDLGATGDMAAKLTDQFVRFGRVTRQDASAAVADFDDILDNWGLSVEDAGGLMDKLLVSNQRFGGSVADNQKTLANLAPALRAANFEVDDAVQLLGLFGAKGLDAQQGAAAFSKALTKVKSPVELKALIADIQATEDPFLRAQKAADLFGAKAGAKLANALGGANLDDYAISMDDAAGATERAADILDSTFSAQLQKKISEAGAALRQFGADTGPAITGLASLASLGATFGLDKALTKALQKAAGSGAVKAASKAVGFFITTTISGAMFIGDKLGEALGAGINRLPGSGALKGALDKAGNFLGSGLGKALSVGFAAVAVVELAKTFDQVTGDIKQQTSDLSAQTAEFAKNALTKDLVNARKGVADELAKLGHDPIADALGLSARKGIEETLATLDAEIARRGPEVGEVLGPSIATGIATGTPAATAAVRVFAGKVADDLAAAGMATEAVRQGRLAAGGVASGIIEAKNTVDQAWTSLVDLIKNAATPAARAGTLIGRLSSKALAAALNDNRPEVRAQAEYTFQATVDELEPLIASGTKIGAKGMDALKAAMKSRNPAIADAARRLYDAARKPLEKLPPKGTAVGRQAGSNVASGLTSRTGVVGNAAANLATTIARRMLNRISALNSAAGAKSNAANADTLFRAAGGPVQAGVPYVVGEHRPELFIPDVPGVIMPRVPATHSSMEAAGGGGDTYQLTVEARRQVDRPIDIVRELRIAATQGYTRRRRRRAGGLA